MKKKLLVMASTFPRWKNDTNPPFVYELSKRLTDKFDVYVLAPHYPGSNNYEIMEGIKVYRFRYFFGRYEKLACSGGILPLLKKNKFYWFIVPFFLLSEFLALRKLTKKIKPDIVHAHWIIPQGFIAALNKKLMGTDYIVTTLGGDLFGLQGKIPTIIKNFSLKNAKEITVVSNAMKNEILNKINPNLNIKVIPMGVDSNLFNPNKKDNFIKKKYNINGPFLLFVGRLTEKKGAIYLIEAMPHIIKEFPKTKLIMIGNGELEKELKVLTSKLGLEKNIIFIGAVQYKELPKYYATADIFIGPSIITKEGDREGLPVTLIESMFSGNVTIATDLEGNKDIIKNNKNGFLIKQNNPKEIEKIVLRLLKINSLFKKIKQNSRISILKKYNWKIIVNSFIGDLK